MSDISFPVSEEPEADLASGDQALPMGVLGTHHERLGTGLDGDSSPHTSGEIAKKNGQVTRVWCYQAPAREDRSVQPQSLWAAVQPGLVSSQGPKACTWDPTVLGECCSRSPGWTWAARTPPPGLVRIAPYVMLSSKVGAEPTTHLCGPMSKWSPRRGTRARLLATTTTTTTTTTVSWAETCLRRAAPCPP